MREHLRLTFVHILILFMVAIIPTKLRSADKEYGQYLSGECNTCHGSSKNPEAELKRGDVIIVERSTINTLAGNMSILQIVASVLTIYMTYLSSQNR